MPRLSAFVTTFNDEGTLRACLDSLRWVDELVVLDSFSTDATLAIAREYTSHVYQQEFLGYGRQKQAALERTTYDWVLFLDSDEMLSPGLQDEIRQTLASQPDVDGFTMPREEQLFWRMASPGTRHNRFLRLFRRGRVQFSTMPVHAAPQLRGRAGRLHASFYHFGETTVHEKVEKLNAYSTGLVEYRAARGERGIPWKMLVYPPLVFVRQYVFKRHFLNGWAGLIAAICMAFYAFLKCAKAYEHRCRRQYGDSRLPARITGNTDGRVERRHAA